MTRPGSPRRSCPALDVSWPVRPIVETVERLLADLDEAHPTAVEDRSGGVRVFFGRLADRDRAAALVRAFDPSLRCATLSVPDESWAERSQAALGPVRVADVVVAPPWSTEHAVAALGPAAVVVTIQPSMGFGTGHHPSTRVCLQLLQARPLAGLSMLDVGTGSGLLALAAWRLAAGRVVAVDVDPDALASARENLERNGASGAIRLDILDVTADAGSLTGTFDVVAANLTGAMLVRTARVLAGWVGRGGTLVAGGFVRTEEAVVRRALTDVGLVTAARVEEDEWAALSASPSASTAR